MGYLIAVRMNDYVCATQNGRVPGREILHVIHTWLQQFAAEPILTCNVLKE